MTRADALAQQAAINATLDAAAAEPDDVRIAMGAINWGDLGCTEIEGRRSFLHDVPEVIVAIIEEASPDATGLRDYVQDKLGRADVFIETEW